MDFLDNKFVVNFNGLHRDNTIKKLSDWLKIDYAYDPLQNNGTFTFI